MKPADLILITDDPGHHLDVKAIATLRKPGAPVVIAGNGLKCVPDGIVMQNGDRREVAGVLVEAVAAYDLTPGEPYHPKGEANAYIVTIGGLRVYFAGVTECVPEIKALKGIDIAFFPLNLPSQRMEPDAAIACIRSFRPRVVYPYHYDQDWVTRVGRGGPGGPPSTRGPARRSRTAWRPSALTSGWPTGTRRSSVFFFFFFFFFLKKKIRLPFWLGCVSMRQPAAAARVGCQHRMRPNRGA